MSFNLKKLVNQCEIFILGFCVLACLFFASCGQDFTTSVKKDSNADGTLAITNGKNSCDQGGCEGQTINGKHYGFNIGGTSTNCPVPSTQLACSMIFTEQEQYQAKCINQSGAALTCGCHSYLCSKKIIFP